MSKVDEAVDEMRLMLAAMAPRHEGLRDYASLNIRDATREAVQAAIAQYDLRKLLLEQALAALESLQVDGYPLLEIPNVTLSVLQDLRENAATIEAALDQFRTDAAGSLNLSAEAPEPK